MGRSEHVLASHEAFDLAVPTAFDGLDQVVLIGSFSKTLSASTRCGFVAARSDWIARLVDLKVATSFGGGRLAAELVLHVLRDGSYRKHTEGLRERLSRAMTEFSIRLKVVGIDPGLEPEAGMFLWCRLPDGIDVAEIAREALEANIVLAPGNAFGLSQSAHAFLRFNVAQSLDGRLFDVLRAAIRRQERSRHQR